MSLNMNLQLAALGFINHMFYSPLKHAGIHGKLGPPSSHTDLES